MPLLDIKFYLREKLEPSLTPLSLDDSCSARHHSSLKFYVKTRLGRPSTWLDYWNIHTL